MTPTAPGGGYSFRLARLRRKAGSRIRRVLLRDDGSDLPSVLVSGTARSGTTWLAEVLARATRSRLMFEPLAPHAVPPGLDVSVFPYLRPDDDAPALEDYLLRVLGGRIRDPWLDKQPVVCRPRGRLVKSVRASFMLGWLARTFPDLVIVYVTRDPWSVVRSRIDAGWDPRPDLVSLLAQPALLASLGPLADRVHRARARLEEDSGVGHADAVVDANAALWAVATRVAHEDLATAGAVHVRYEALRADPHAGFSRLIEELGSRGAFDVTGAARALRGAERPSMTSRGTPPKSGREPFRRRFGAESADRVAAVAEAFGLGWTLQPPVGRRP